ncbi:MAG: hypothetical protein P0Y64_09430 [Candidatus Sphingomonas colombiensis]|nr:hypothetical protein [Sphingomonas sp.]WEK41659.1 MAG: hypothetical protein P0Y64_09430 [Sphingomonas sp.]
MRGPGVAALLERRLTIAAQAAGTAIAIAESRGTEWHSATFSGMRHEIMAEAATCPMLDRWLAELAEAELPVAGHIVADIAIAGIERDAARTRFRLEALTVANG